MLTRCTKAYSSSSLQTVSLSPAISSRLLRGYHSLMPSWAAYLERRKSRLGLLKSKFNAKNFIRSLSMPISIDFGVIRSCNVSRVSQPEIAKKIHKTPILAFEVIQGHWIRRQSRASVRLVINSNLGPISHRYWDTATYWPKIANFTYPLQFSALVQGDSFRIYGKASRFLKLESSRQPTVKIWWF